MVGFSLSFIPMYILGLMGATRRLDTYDVSTGWRPFFVTMLIGGLVIAVGVAFQIIQIIASVMEKRRLRDRTGDPWNARTLEWSVPSPAPEYNFTTVPQVASREPFWDMKQAGIPKEPVYQDIHMPKNTASGIYISIFAFFVGFGFVWHITWMAIAGILGAIVFTILRTFDENVEYTIPAAEVKRREEARVQKERELYGDTPPVNPEPEHDMTLRQFIVIVASWAWSLVTRKQKGRAS
jgi:cytochrome o ubiquinol oxidase subunit 1